MKRAMVVFSCFLFFFIQQETQTKQHLSSCRKPAYYNQPSSSLIGLWWIIMTIIRVLSDWLLGISILVYVEETQSRVIAN